MDFGVDWFLQENRLKDEMDCYQKIEGVGGFNVNKNWREDEKSLTEEYQSQLERFFHSVW